MQTPRTPSHRCRVPLALRHVSCKCRRQAACCVEQAAQVECAANTNVPLPGFGKRWSKWAYKGPTKMIGGARYTLDGKYIDPSTGRAVTPTFNSDSDEDW